ncbi:MAG: M24 family metallopeptidase [Thermoplasmatota archaeon]
MEYERRWRALGRELERRRAGALVVQHPHNIRYLCCSHLHTAAPPTYLVFTGSGAPTALTSFLERSRTEEECAVGPVRVWGRLPGMSSEGRRAPLALMRLLKELGASRVLVDRRIEGLEGVRQTQLDIIERMRAVKSEEELALIRRACAIADRGARELRSILRSGATELEVANELDHFLRAQGAQATAFPTIVAGGHRSAYPHHDCSAAALRDTMVVCDFGVCVGGYCSDITRTYAIGTPPEPLVRAHRAVAEAVEAGIGAVRAGAGIRRVDGACRRALRRLGLERYFVHSTGHGIGLEVHEAPTAGPFSKELMRRGMVFTIEPGVYIPKLGGVRIEQDVLVSGRGAELLTKSSVSA